jgi:hypothetical protein
MDPEACVCLCNEAENHLEFMENFHDLIDWLHKGGHMPLRKLEVPNFLDDTLLADVLWYIDCWEIPTV